MNILVVLAVAVVFGLLRFRRTGLLTWAAAWWIGIYVLLRFGFSTPIPASVITLYMGIVSLGIVAYVSSSQQRREEIAGPLIRFMTEKRYTPFLAAAVLGIPALAAANVYMNLNVPLQPPFFPRTIHPASPPDVTVNVLAPGAFLTDMNAPLRERPGHTELVAESAALKRWGVPHEIGPVIVLMASGAMDFMTGSVVSIDGGTQQ